MYGYIYVTDRDEGLILVPAGTLLDGNPLNNFLGRELTFNPGGILNGARAITIVGTFAYISCDAGLVVVVARRPQAPGGDVDRRRAVPEASARDPGPVSLRLRLRRRRDQGPRHHRPGASPARRRRCRCATPASIYLARTYAYVAAGPEGLVILDIERPERAAGSTRSSMPAAASTT